MTNQSFGCGELYPAVGDALLWWNVDEDGVEDPRTLHAGVGRCKLDPRLKAID